MQAIVVSSSTSAILAPRSKASGGLIGVGVMLSGCDYRRVTNARLEVATVDTTKLNLLATDTSVSRPVTNVGSGGGVAASYANTHAKLERTTEASIPSSTRLILNTGNLDIKLNQNQRVTPSRSDSAGVIAVGAINIESEAATTTVHVGRFVNIIVPDDNKTGEIRVEADAENLVFANSVNYSGGGISVQNTNPTATDNSVTEAIMLGNIVGPDGTQSNAPSLPCLRWPMIMPLPVQIRMGAASFRWPIQMSSRKPNPPSM